MTDAERITELKRSLKIALYDCHSFQVRLDKLRAVKDELIRLIAMPTLAERLDIGSDPSDEDVLSVTLCKAPADG